MTASPAVPGPRPGTIRVTCTSAQETHALGARLGRSARPGEVFALSGELGAGKTCFIQGLAEGLGIEGQVQSPTFVLVAEHRGRLPLYHVDLYRTASLAEKRGPVGARLHDLSPRPGPVIEAQARSSVLGPGPQEGGDRRHGRAGEEREVAGAASHTRMTSSTVTRVASMARVWVITASAYSGGTPATASVTMATE